MNIGKQNTKYKIKLTEEFILEVEEIYNYISNKLMVKDAANRLLKQIIYNLNLIPNLPKMFAKINQKYKTKREYRRIVIGNYIILYTVDDNERNIYIAHIYYSERNYLENL